MPRSGTGKVRRLIMKNVFTAITLLATVMLSVVSCLKEEEAATTAECFISAVSVGDIASTLATKTADGRDSTYTKTLSGKSVYFNIDQVDNKIVSVDSLPSWVDVSRVVPTLTYTGYLFCRQRGAELFGSFANGTDSVDFTQKVEFLVVASDGATSKQYTAEIRKRTSDSDSLYWTAVEGTDVETRGASRMVALDGRVYLFSASGGIPTVTSADAASDGTSWTAPAELADVPSMDAASVTAFNGSLFALDADGRLYRSTSLEEGRTWALASGRTFARLLAADRTYLYASDGARMLASADLVNWEECGADDMEMLPEGAVGYAAYATRTNTSLQNVVMLGLSPNNTANAVAWYKISAADNEVNQKWAYIKVTADNGYGMPRLEHLQLLHYNGELLAFGGRNAGASTEDGAEAYGRVYRSADNGVTWHAATSKVGLPSELKGAAGKAVLAAVGGGKIWLLQEDGRLWLGAVGSTAR